MEVASSRQQPWRRAARGTATSVSTAWAPSVEEVADDGRQDHSLDRLEEPEIMELEELPLAGLRSFTAEEVLAEERERAASELEQMEVLEALMSGIHYSALIVQEQVEAQGIGLDQMEANVAGGRNQVHQAAEAVVRASLTDARFAQIKLYLLSPAVVLVVAVPATIVAGPLVAAGAGIASGTVAVATQSALLHKHTKKLERIQRQLRNEGQQMPTLTQQECMLVEKQGNAALQTMMADLESARDVTRVFTPLSIMKDLPLCYQRSRVRPDGGLAYRTRFTMPAPSTAASLFPIMHRILCSRSIDPKCSMVWPRPVSESTSIRYMCTSSIGQIITRDFHVLCHAARLLPNGMAVAATSDIEQQGLAGRDASRYAVVVQSLNEELQKLSPYYWAYREVGTPGHIRWFGYIIADEPPPGRGVCVEVVADLDPEVDNLPLPNALSQGHINREVRRHVLNAASALRETLIHLC
mmetsp:Transcript_68432/g.164306  ORF Transcript_68432/g.164306 Transcript_68432/m.164306 type:complete len:469 (+) Transcript_68432:105-1511(+)